MSYDYDIDDVVECVKNIVDCHRCPLCDKLEGSRWRYYCGHIGCGECVTIAISCVHCLSPLDMASPEPVQDHTLTKRAEHASNLLSTFQNAFDIDVYKYKEIQHRISDHLKMEKEVFPECIQAPVKYTNKRKSLNVSVKKDEKRSLFLGENVSPVRPLRRDKSFSYIHNWLDKIDDYSPQKIERKPLSTLNVNNDNKKEIAKSSFLKRRADLIMDKVYESEMPAKKKWIHKDDKDESGIFIDEPIYIDDTEDEFEVRYDYGDTFDLNKRPHSPLTVDKDKQAWLAVLEAEKSEQTNTPAARLECNEVINYTNDIEKSVTHANNTKETHTDTCKEVIKDNNDTEKSLVNASNTLKSDTATCKVPFYKKSYLIPVQSNNNLPQKITPTQSKNVEITIENKSFITTIKVMNVEAKEQNKKQSVLVQTDISGHKEPNVRMIEIETAQSISKEVQEGKMDKYVEKDSEDLFTAELKVSEEKPNSKFKVSDEKLNPDVKETIKPDFKDKPNSKTVISDSDSDDEFNKCDSFIVAAEVHRSCDQKDYGVFSELEQTELVSRLRKRKPRGHTPHSSDSSDKENRDPNRAKRIKLDKKDPIKKKSRKKLGVVN